MSSEPIQTTKSASSLPLLAFFGLLLVGLVILGLAGWALRQFRVEEPSGALQHQAVGLPMPGLRLQPLDDLQETVDLADFEGKVLLVNFWGTWCPPCRTELPHMNELDLELRGDDGFRMFAVSCANGPEDDLEQLAEETAGFLRHYDFELPVYLDADYVTREMLYADPRYVPGFAFPTTLVVDRGGTIRGVWIGYRSGYEKEMAKLVDELLKEKAK